MSLSANLLLLALAFQSSLAVRIGPVTDLVVSSVEVSPDGFNRTAALAGGTVIGPLIAGNKVSVFVLEYRRTPTSR